MNNNWQAEIRAQLEQKKAELHERVAKIKADITGGLEADSKEQAAQLENQEVLDALANEGVHEISLITAALRKMDEGTFGICSECGEEIGIGRLKARPFASKCINCAN